MRRRLLVGVGAVTLAVASVLVSLSLAAAVGRGPLADGTAPSPDLSAPVSGACLPGTQQCNPVVPRPGGGAAPVIAMVATLVTAGLALVAGTGLRRRRRAGRLPTGVVPTLLRPPRVRLLTI
jgi:hypothetical protein